MTKRRAITWAVVRALALGMLLTLAAARTRDVLGILGYTPRERLGSARHEAGELMRRRSSTEETVHLIVRRIAAIPTIGQLADQSRAAHWSPEILPPQADWIPTGKTVTQIAEGWPMRAFAARVEMKGDWQVSHGIKWGFGRHAGVICLHPLWYGLVVDVLFFACVVGVLEMSLRSARRWKRSRAGKCASCGYSRAGLSTVQVCPECGGKA